MELYGNKQAMLSGMTSDIVDDDLSSYNNNNDLKMSVDGLSEYVDHEIEVLGAKHYPPKPAQPPPKIILHATHMSLPEVYHSMNKIAFGGKLPTMSGYIFDKKNAIVRTHDGTIVLTMKKKKTKAEQLELLFGLMGMIYNMECEQNK